MNIDYEDVRRMKRLDLPEILKSYGIPLKSRNDHSGSTSSPQSFMALCPFHDDKNPSLSLSKVDDRWLFRCFGCHVSGTVIDFVMKKENLSLQDTYSKLKSMTPEVHAPDRSPHNGNGNGVHSPNPIELLKLVADFYHKTFVSDQRGVEYLKSRGIKSPEIYESFKIGFANGSLKKILSLKSETTHELRHLGILNGEGNEFFYNSIVIPLFDEDGNVVSLYGRNVSQKRHLYLKGPHKGLVNRQGAFGADKVILTESILDALSLYELGIRNVIPCYGTGGFTADHKTLLLKQGTKGIELSFDNDSAGLCGAKALANEYGPGVTSALVKLPDGIKDLNDFLVAGKTKEEFLNLPREVFTPKASSGALIPAGDYEVEKSNGILHIKTQGRLYRIYAPERDLIRSLRVNIKLIVQEKIHIDILDLYSQRQRKMYQKRVADKFEFKEEDIERDLYRILEEIEKLEAESKKPGEEAKPPMSDEEKAEALEALKNPALTELITQDLERIGCVGEDSPKLLGYIVTISRRLEMPLSMIIVSQSGAGKSNLADTLESIVPKDECVHLSRITPQALYYMEKDALKRKVLIIEEKEGSRDSDYSIRVLQSKQVLRLAVPVKDLETGKMKTTTFEVEGPVVVIETTAKSDVNPENASRCYIVYLDESEDQTKRIHAFQRKLKTLDGLKEKAEARRLIQKHQNMQRLLEERVVHIPFVDHLKFPSKWMRTRRDYQKFLNLIEAVTFLHQYRRESKETPDGIKYIESTLEDYKIAYELSKDIFGDLLSELMKPEKDFLQKIKAMLKAQGILKFTCRMVREYTALPDHVVRRGLDILVRMEYLGLTEGKAGMKFEYQINPEPSKVQEIIEGLTTPEELKRRLLGTLREPFMKVNPIKSNEITQPFELLGKT